MNRSQHCLSALFIALLMPFTTNAQHPEQMDERETEKEITAFIDNFLAVAGNYDLDSMAAMITPDANIGIVRIRDGKWQSSTKSFEQYQIDARSRELGPYYEPVQEYSFLHSEGPLVLVKADAILHEYGRPRSRNIDLFTVAKFDGMWKIISVSFTTRRLPDEERQFDIEAFAKAYSQAWCGQRKDFVARFFEEDGSLAINDGDAAVGREAIAEVVQSFMTDLPDMQVLFDKLVPTKTGYGFHWTLDATNTGPGGTGKHVRVSGYEEWTLGPNNRIQRSQGHFPSDE